MGDHFKSGDDCSSSESELSGVDAMKLIGVLLVLTGVCCMASSTIGFGDIGLAFGAIGWVAILAGIGFLKLNKRISKFE